MEQERTIDKLAGYLIKLGVFAIIAALCWYFRSVLVYIIAAFVLSLIGMPVVRLLKKVTIKGKAAPDWLLAVLTILVIVGFVVLIITQVVPVVTGIIRDASLFSSRGVPDISLVDKFNGWLVSLFPSLGKDFDVVKFLIDQLKAVTNVSNVSGMIGSVASAVIGTAVGETIDIDKKFTRLGNWFEAKVSGKGSSSFARSFISGALLFCIGSMTIMGAIEAGLRGEHTIYYTKGLIDMVSAATFAMGSGIGVAFSAIPLVIYQGLLVLASSLLGDVLSAETIAMSSQIGSLILIPLALNLLGVTNVKVANYIPAMFVPFVWQLISSFM